MNYRQFSTGFWDDKYIYDLPDHQKLLFAFYFTNEKVNMAGIYEIQDRRVLYFHKHLKENGLQQAKKKFEADSKYFFYEDWVYVANNHKNNQYSTNQYVVQSFLDEFNHIPKHVREYFFEEKALKYIPPFNLKKINYSLNEEKEMVMVIEKEKEKEKRLGGSLSNGTDVIDIEEVSKGIDEQIAIERKLKELQNEQGN